MSIPWCCKMAKEQILMPSKVRKHKRSERIASMILGEATRCLADAARKPIGHHGCPGTDIALGHCTTDSALEGTSKYLLANW